MGGTWPQAGYDGQRTNYNPDAVGLPDAADARLTWRGREPIRTVLVAHDEYVVCGQSTVFGVDRETGDPNWHCPVDTSPLPVVTDEVVYYRRGFHGVERAADRTEWHRSSAISSTSGNCGLTIHDGAAFVGTCGGSEADIGDVYGVAVADRQVGFHAAATGGVTSGPFVTDDAVVVGYGPVGPAFHTGIEAYDRPTGDRRWTIRSSLDGSCTGEFPTIHPTLLGNDRVYGVEANTDAVADDHVTAYDLTDGTVDWRRESPAVPAALIRDLLYLIDGNRVVALDSHTGNLVWERDPSRTGDDGVDSPSVAASLQSLCVGGTTPVALDPDTGEVLWRLDEPLTVHAVVDDELVGSQGRTLHVFEDPTVSASKTRVYDPDAPSFCPDCGHDLSGSVRPDFCPNCGASL